MFCNQKGVITDLSKPPHRSCFLGKCGGWKNIKGAWLPASAVCSLSLYSKYSPVCFDCVFQDITSLESYSANGATIILSDYFDPNDRVKAYIGNTGSTLIVPAGYNRAVFISSDGVVDSEDVVPGQVLVFRSNVIIGGPGVRPCPVKYDCKVEGDWEPGKCNDTHFRDITAKFCRPNVPCPQVCREPPDCCCPPFVSCGNGCCPPDRVCCEEVCCLPGQICCGGACCSPDKCQNGECNSSSSSSSSSSTYPQLLGKNKNIYW